MRKAFREVVKRNTRHVFPDQGGRHNERDLCGGGRAGNGDMGHGAVRPRYSPVERDSHDLRHGWQEWHGWHVNDGRHCIELFQLEI